MTQPEVPRPEAEMQRQWSGFWQSAKALAFVVAGFFLWYSSSALVHTIARAEAERVISQYDLAQDARLNKIDESIKDLEIRIREDRARYIDEVKKDTDTIKTNQAIIRENQRKILSAMEKGRQ